MNINVRTQGFDLTKAINAFACQQLAHSLHRFEDKIAAVDVFLRDINGPKGGIDKQVLTRVHLRSGRVLATETTRADLYAAMTACSKRSKRSVRRATRKAQRVERQRLRQIRSVRLDGLQPAS